RLARTGHALGTVAKRSELQREYDDGHAAGGVGGPHEHAALLDRLTIPSNPVARDLPAAPGHGQVRAESSLKMAIGSQGDFSLEEVSANPRFQVHPGKQRGRR